MLGLFAAKPPLTTIQRVNLECLTRHTVEVFGRDFVIARQPVLSLGELNLRSTATSPEELLQSIGDQLSARFGLQSGEMSFQLQTRELDTTSDEFTVDSDEILVHPRVLEAHDQLRMVMTIAEAFSLVAWQRRSTRPLDTDRRTTSLLPILLGMAVLASDASLYDDQWSTGGWSGWSLSRAGYYNTMEIGYVAALLTRLRGSASSSWLKQMRLDSRATAKQALRYFRDRDAKQVPLLLDASRIPATHRGAPELADWLRGEDSDFALAAAMVLRERESVPKSVLEAAIDAVRGKDRNLITEATRLLGKADSPEPVLVEQLKRLARQRDAPTALAAIESATNLGLPHRDYLDAANRLLGYESFDLLPVLRWIESGGSQCERLSNTICQHLADAVRHDHTVAIHALLDCLTAINNDAARVITTQIKIPELQSEAMAHLRQQHAATEADN